MYYSKENQYLINNFIEKIEMYKARKKISNTCFLDSNQLKILVNIANKYNILYSVERYTNECEKAIIHVGAKQEDVITCFKIDNCPDIKHSDILGSLFGLGLKKEVIGDIFVEADASYFMVLTSVKDIIKNHLHEIGTKNVKLVEINKLILKEEHLLPLSILSNSFRIDSILAKILKISRAMSEELLTDKKVLVNYTLVSNDNLLLKENDIISVRGYGKYKVGSVNGVTKAKKYRIEIFQYK